MVAIIILLICSGIPFFLIQFIPGKKSFAILTVIFLGLMAYGYYDIHKPIVNDLSDGPGAVLGMIFLYFIGYGIIAGIITKVATLYMASKNISRKKRILASFVGLLIIPCLIYMPTLLKKMEVLYIINRL